MNKPKLFVKPTELLGKSTSELKKEKSNRKRIRGEDGWTPHLDNAGVAFGWAFKHILR